LDQNRTKESSIKFALFCSTSHEITLAIESSVSPWKSDACALDGSARIAVPLCVGRCAHATSRGHLLRFGGQLISAEVVRDRGNPAAPKATCSTTSFSQRQAP